MQNRAQQRIVDLDLSVVVDEAKSAEFVHEKTDAGAGGANHLRQCFLADIRTDRLRAAFLSEIREQQKYARKPPLARIKQLVNQVLFDPAVPGQEISHKQLGKFRLIMKGGDHTFFRNSSDHAIFHRRRGRDPQLVAVHAAFTEELAGFQDRDDCFLALLGQDGEFDPAFLNVKDGVGNVALLEHLLIFVKFQYRLSPSYFGEKDFRVKHVLG